MLFQCRGSGKLFLTTRNFSKACILLSMRLLLATISAGVLWLPQVLGRANTTAPNYTVDELWKLETTFWDNFLYPANVEQMEAINSTLFTPDVCGG